MQRRPEFSFPGGARPPRPAEEEEVRWLQASRQASPDHYSSSSGTPSPQMWRAHHDHDHHRRQYPASAGSSPPLPSASREQVIAGYRREMLDLVRGLPETAYELSLRDIVEHHHHRPASPPAPAPLPAPPSPPPAAAHSDVDAATGHEPVHAAATMIQEQGARQSTAKQRAVRRQRSRSVERSVSLDTGRLIKLFLPLSIHGRRKKKVSPKPDAKHAKKKKQGSKNKEQDEEWWGKGDFSEDASARTSSTGSTNSNSSTASAANGAGATDQRRAAPVRSRSR